MTEASDNRAVAEMNWRTHVDTRLVAVEGKAASHEARLDAHDSHLETRVSQDAFMPIKLFVYGLMGTLGAAVMGCLLKLVINARWLP